MDREIITTLVLAILASNGFFALVQFLITRWDTKKSIKGKLDHLEKDGLRTQLLLLILLQPDEQTEILKIAEHYFVKLKGNWYMTSVFSKWCKSRGLRPEWFKFADETELGRSRGGRQESPPF